MNKEKTNRTQALARLQIQIADWIGDHLGEHPHHRDAVALAMARVALAAWENDRDGYPSPKKDNSKRLRKWSREAYGPKDASRPSLLASSGPKDALRPCLLASSYLKQVANAYEADFCRNICYKPHSIRVEVDKVLQHVKSWQEFFKETYTTEHAVYNLHFCYITDVAEESK